MLDRERARAICTAALRASTADGCEVRLGGGRDAVTRFANNAIHQNMASESYELSVRSVIGRRTGRASTLRLDDAGIRDVVAASERITRWMPEREEALDLAPPSDPDPVPGAYDEATAGIDPLQRAERAAAMIAAARARGAQAAGIVRWVEGDVGDYGEKGTLAVANSNGLFAYHRGTFLQCTSTVLAEDSSGWADAAAHDGARVDAAEVGRIAAEKAVASAHPVEVPPGDYTVILEPAAVAELVAFLGPEFSATVVDEGRSFLSNRQGQRIFGEGVTLTSDPFHPLHQARPFDEEGVPTRRVVLVENGVHKNLVYDRAAAARHGVEPTGHGLRVPSTDGAVASSLVLEGEGRGLEDLIRETRHGILVTRVWYTRPVDPAQLIITGMTRDGTFLVRDGEIQGGVRNLRFNQSLVDLLGAVEASGEPVYAWPCVVPALRVGGFRFTSVTSF